jgi:hypothetical protein
MVLMTTIELDGTDDYWITKGFREKGDNDYFAFVYMSSIAGDAHVVSVKLDRSKFGGWLNKSYPCALFDPNFGDAKFDNEKDLSICLAALFQKYTTDFGWQLNKPSLIFVPLDKCD